MKTIDLSPFLITGFTNVANSGGKTSGYNLWLHLQSNGGGLTNNGCCVFTNTGWEHPLTLDFLAEQERRWSIPIHWLEFTRRPATAEELTVLEKKWESAIDRAARFRSEPASFFKPKKIKGMLILPHPEQLKADGVRKAEKYALDKWESFQKATLIGMDTFRRVNRNTANLNGGPYQELLDGLLLFRNRIKNKPGVLPNGVQRICTGHLKVRLATQFARETWGVGRSGFECRLGLRSDEQDRIKNAESWDGDGGRAVFPLDTAGIQKEDVFVFWKAQGWGLTLKSHEGNCAGCFMKRRSALIDLIRRDFFDVVWWHEWEQRAGQQFRSERSYHGLIMAAKQETLLPPEDGDNGISCETGYCTD